jgi:hypothetical protein
MVNVFKEKDYQQDSVVESSIPPINFEDLLSGLGGLRSDFGDVVEAAKKFPIRSTLTVIGFITVLYIGFKVGSKFVKI